MFTGVNTKTAVSLKTGEQLRSQRVAVALFCGGVRIVALALFGSGVHKLFPCKANANTRPG